MYYQFVIVFCVYLLAVFMIGFISSIKAHGLKKVTEQSADLLLGGRSTHWFLTALSAHAADMSDWLFMGLPAAVYMCGAKEIWIPIGLLVGMFMAWHFIAKPLRKSSEEYNALTLASYFNNRFHDTSGILIIIAALISFFYFTIYLSVGLKGIGYVLQAAFNLNYHIGIALALGVITTYTILGGFVSVAWLDLFQGIFLLAMLLLVPIYAFFTVGGASAIIQSAAADHISLALVPDFSIVGVLSILLNQFAWCLGYMGMPHILTKFMGSSDAESLHKAKYVGLTWQFLATFAAVAVGLVGIAYFSTGLAKPEFIFIQMTKELFNPWLAGVILCAILAATISTVDSQLLVLASIISNDFYKNIFCKQAKPSQILRVFRFSLCAAGIVGFAIASNEQSTIMALVKYAWAGLGASFGPLMILSVYSKRINKYGAIAGIITGAVISAVWNFINPFITTMPIYAMVPAFMSGLLVIYGVSLMTEKW